MRNSTDKIIAIDILLEPDGRMLQRAAANNARLLKAFPTGFALDATHQPHITLYQCFVPAQNLGRLYAAAGGVLNGAHVTAMSLEGIRYYYLPAPGGTGGAGIVVRATPELLKLQVDVIAAALPFTVKTATIDSITAPHENPAFDAVLLDYVEKFVAEHSGDKYVPHVTTGVALREYLDAMLAEPFESFVFSPAAAAVYQLGPFGTAAKKLKAFDPKPSTTLDGLSEVLPSWNAGPAKQSIVDFVNRVTSVGSPDFVPAAERVAVFDNDGTLWAEQPFPVQLMFLLDRVHELASQHPEWKSQQPFKGVLENDMKAAATGGMAGLMEMAKATHAGMTTEEFELIVKDWIAAARHPRFERPFTDLVYQPMLEVLDFLRANGFKTFIVSGGGIEFMRTFSEVVYGVPPEQVIGSSIVTKYMIRDGRPGLSREASLNFYDDKEAKPVAINMFIGRRPLVAFGNSDGDFAMLEWVAGGAGARLAAIVHHDDAVREFAYDRESPLQQLARGLDEGPKRGWTIVSMTKDWNRVFPFEETE
jgi:haloacid dehalogenase-like hydrolase